MLLKIQNPVLKYPIVVKTFKNTKNKFEKKKERKHVFVHTDKCLKAKKIISYFSYIKNHCFNIHFGFNNQFIKVKKTLAKISKTTKILFCLILVSRIMNLYVNHIPDIKKVFSFDDLE